MQPVKLIVFGVPCREEGEPILSLSVKSEMSPNVLGEPIPATCSYIPIFRVVYNGLDWDIVRSRPENATNSCALEGALYVEQDETVLAKAKNGNVAPLTNAMLRVVGIKERWETDDDYVRYLCCEVQCKAWKEGSRTIEVPWTEYKDVYQQIRRKFPDVCVMGQGQALEEYLADVFARSADNLTVYREAKLSGWICWDGGAHYVVGKDDFYRNHAIPKTLSNSYAVFHIGRRFLDIGNRNPQICVLYLASHLAYTLFWLKKAGIRFQSTFFVQGGTGLLKTSVVRIISDVFNTDRDKAVMRLNSTLASTQKTITYLRDTVVCVDDFSNTESDLRRKSLSSAEAVIRAVGDGTFPSKSDVSDFSKITQNTVRSVVILTGEEGLDLGASSQLRMLIIPVEQGTFDGRVLREFQIKNIWAEYTAQYLKFLEENGEAVVSYSKDAFYAYRDGCAKYFDAPRLIDAAAVLHLECDIIAAYARWCGCGDEEVQQLSALLHQNVVNVIRITQDYTSEAKPEVRFLRALWESLDTTKAAMVAESEDVYADNEAQFIGFYETHTGTIWLRPEVAYQVVCQYYRTINERWLTSIKRVKELLLEKNLSRGKLGSSGQSAEYTCRAKKGTRKRMLVLYVEKVEKLLAEEEK